MINRANWHLTNKYLEYRFQVDQVSKLSLKAEETHLRYFLKWLDEKPLNSAEKIRPTFPEFMQKKAHGDDALPFSETYIKKVLASARNFIIWVTINQNGHKNIFPWVNTLKVKRMQEFPKTREYVTLEEILNIAVAPCKNIQEQRTKAMAVFLFLSGIRIDAFVSLPLKAVKIERLEVLQYPNLGVRTKNRKAAKTYLHPIPELITVVKNWDSMVRDVLPPGGFWFAPLNPRTREIDPSNLICPPNRKSVAARNLKEWLESVGLTYHSPHKFRHGHVHYGNARAITQADRKAISMNVMHSNVGITDTFYSNHSEEDLKNRINQLTKKEKTDFDVEEFREFQAFMRWKSTQ